MQPLFFDWILPLTAASSAACLLLLLLAPLTERRLSARWHSRAWCFVLLFFALPIRLPASVTPVAALELAALWPTVLSPQGGVSPAAVPA